MGGLTAQRSPRRVADGEPDHQGRKRNPPGSTSTPEISSPNHEKHVITARLLQADFPSPSSLTAEDVQMGRRAPLIHFIQMPVPLCEVRGSPSSPVQTQCSSFCLFQT